MKQTTTCGWMVLLAVLTMAGSFLAQEPNAADLLQSGRVKETFHGDLDAAIDLYKQAIQQAGGNRALAAEARLRLGAAYQKLGNPEARAVLEGLVRDYPDEERYLAEARERLAAMPRTIQTLFGTRTVSGPPAIPSSSETTVTQEAAPESPVTAILRVDLSAFRDGAKVLTESHVLESQPGRVASVRSGSEVPVPDSRVGGTTLQQMGTQIDCVVRPTDSAMFRVEITITNRAIFEETEALQIPLRAPGVPTFRNFIVAGTLLLADGQTTRFAGFDRITNTAWQADVALAVKQ